MEDIRCRICFETSKTLISVCGCTGSIQYVHEECILDWIATKLETSGKLEIPLCEICHEGFSARMVIGKKRLSFKYLVGKVASMSKKDAFEAIFHFVMLITCIFVVLQSMHYMVSSFLMAGSALEEENKPLLPSLQYIFTNVLVEIYGILSFFNYLKTKEIWVRECMVNVVEVVLQPKIIRKG